MKKPFREISVVLAAKLAPGTNVHAQRNQDFELETIATVKTIAINGLSFWNGWIILSTIPITGFAFALGRCGFAYVKAPPLAHSGCFPTIGLGPGLIG